MHLLKTYIHHFFLGISHILLIFAISACNSGSPKTNPEKRLHNLETIKNITFHEVRRTFASGISFNEMGFQQEPEWSIVFLSNEKVKVYSPLLKKMVNADVIYSHGGVYNIAREWLRIIHLSKDSIKLQRLEVNAKVIAKDIRSEVFMTFYAEAYIKRLKKELQQLRKPNLSDTAYVKSRIRLTNENPADSTYFFAARNPVIIESISDNVSVEKITNVNKLEGKGYAYDYLYPEYTVNIKKAYKDFAYSLSVTVDTTGKMTVYKFNSLEENRESRKKVLQGILDVYVQRMCKILAGNTLDNRHNSLIVLNLIGKR